MVGGVVSPPDSVEQSTALLSFEGLPHLTTPTPRPHPSVTTPNPGPRTPTEFPECQLTPPSTCLDRYQVPFRGFLTSLLFFVLKTLSRLPKDLLHRNPTQTTPDPIWSTLLHSSLDPLRSSETDHEKVGCVYSSGMIRGADHDRDPVTDLPLCLRVTLPLAKVLPL